jgi:hypothetical protein
MAGAQILIVEDESIVALDLGERLVQLGYLADRQRRTLCKS